MVNGTCTNLTGIVDYDFQLLFNGDEETLADVVKYKAYMGYSSTVSEGNEPTYDSVN